MTKSSAINFRMAAATLSRSGSIISSIWAGETGAHPALVKHHFTPSEPLAIDALRPMSKAVFA